MPTARNRLATAISNTPGSAGALTIAAALAGYRTFAAADDGLKFDVVIVDGTAWEVRTDCTYTHAGTSLSRGTLEDSSSGAAINLTSAAIVRVTRTAGRDNMLPGLQPVAITGTKDGSNLSFTIPAPAAGATYEACWVVWNGQWLNAGLGFTRVSQAITMAAGYAPASSDDFYAVVQTQAANGNLRAAAVTGTKDGSNVTFGIPDGSVTTCYVVLNGQWLSAGNGFTRASAVITMAAAPGSTDDLYAFVA